MTAGAIGCVVLTGMAIVYTVGMTCLAVAEYRRRRSMRARGQTAPRTRLKSHRPGQVKGVGLLALVVGAVMLLMGLSSLDGSQKGVTCGGERMHPGDQCLVTRTPGGTETYTYHEMAKREKPHQPSWPAFAVGLPALAIGGGILVAQSLYDRRQRRHAGYPNRQQRWAEDYSILNWDGPGQPPR